jgi:hypothetical protein
VSTYHNSFSSLPLQDVQSTMDSEDQVIDSNGDWEDELVSIEPSSVHPKHEDLLQTSLSIVDPLSQPPESNDQFTHSNKSDADALPLSHELVESHKVPPQSRERSKERQARVEGGRIMLKKMKMQLRARYKKLDDDKDLLLQELIELNFDNLRTKHPALIEKYEEIAAARQRLGPAELEYDKTEEQLNDDEWHQHALESTVYGDHLSPSNSDFPAGWLDFTGQEPHRASSRSSLASVAYPSLPETEEYEDCRKEADAWRKKKLNLESEHEQLVRQKAKRTRLGLTLDPLSQEIFESYDGELKYLTSQLEQAEVRLEHAKAVWTRRKSTLEQISQVTDSNTNTALSPPYAEPNKVGDDATVQEEYYYKLADMNEVPPEHQNDLASEIAQILQQSEPEPTPIFRVPSLNSNGQHVNMAAFINQWLLQRVRVCPEETVRLAKYLASANPGLTAEQTVEASLSTWLSDGSEKEFFVAVEAGDHSFHESLAPNNGLVKILHDRAASQRPLMPLVVRPGGPVAYTYH